MQGARRNNTPEQVIKKLRQAEGSTVAEASRRSG